MSKIFISHASKDDAVSDAFVKEVLEGGIGFPHSRICHTSSPGTIPVGTDVPAFLRGELDEAKLVVLLLSPNFSESSFCMAELGAAWVQKKAFPLLLPPQDYAELEGVFEVTQAAKLDDAAALDGLRDRVIRNFDFQQKDTARWNARRKVFLEDLPELLDSLESPERVPRSQLRRVTKQLEAAQHAVEEVTREVKQKETLIEKLKEIKDSDEVSKVVSQELDDWERFEDMLATTCEYLNALEPATRLALFYEMRGESGFKPAEHTKSAPWDCFWDDIQPAKDMREVSVEEDRGLVFPNTDKLRVRKALESLRELDGWLRHDDDGASTAFWEAYAEKYDRKPRLDDRDFWDEHLDSAALF